MVEQGEDISSGNCGLPYYFGGLVPDLAALRARTAEDFRRQGIEVLTNHRAVAIDSRDKRVRVVTGGHARELGYDKLILATGARSRSLGVPGSDLNGVLGLRTLADGRQLDKMLANSKVTRVCIVGGGYIGLEMAENLASRGLEVSLVQRASQVLPALDPQLAEIVHEHLYNKIKLYLGAELLRLEGGDEVERAVCNTVTVATDLVLVATGVVPDTCLARTAGLELDARSAVVVDRHLRASVPDIWAAGDCTRHWHRVLEEWSWLPLGDTANKMGRVAAVNAAGGSSEFAGVAGTAAVKVFDLHVAHTGVNLAVARQYFDQADAVQITTADRPNYYPGGGRLTCRLIYLGDGRVVGCQAVGTSPAAVEVVNLAAGAVARKAAVRELQELDLAYAPPYSPAWHPLLVLVNQVKPHREKIML